MSKATIRMNTSPSTQSKMIDVTSHASTIVEVRQRLRLARVFKVRVLADLIGLMAYSFHRV